MITGKASPIDTRDSRSTGAPITEETARVRSAAAAARKRTSPSLAFLQYWNIKLIYLKKERTRLQASQFSRASLKCGVSFLFPMKEPILDIKISSSK